jgi:hypothetical protein
MLYFLGSKWFQIIGAVAVIGVTAALAAGWLPTAS